MLADWLKKKFRPQAERDVEDWFAGQDDMPEAVVAQLKNVIMRSSAFPPEKLERIQNHLGEMRTLERLRAIKKLARPTIAETGFRMPRAVEQRKALISLFKSMRPPGSYKNWQRRCRSVFFTACQEDKSLQGDMRAWRQGLRSIENGQRIVDAVIEHHRVAFSSEGFNLPKISVEWADEFSGKLAGHYLPLDPKAASREQGGNKIQINAKRAAESHLIFLLDTSIHEYIHLIQDHLQHAYKNGQLPRRHPAYKGAQFFYLMQKDIRYFTATEIEEYKDIYIAQPIEDDAHSSGMACAILIAFQQAPSYIRSPLRAAFNGIRAWQGKPPMSPAPF